MYAFKTFDGHYCSPLTREEWEPRRAPDHNQLGTFTWQSLCSSGEGDHHRQRNWQRLNQSLVRSNQGNCAEYFLRSCAYESQHPVTTVVAEAGWEFFKTRIPAPTLGTGY